MNKEQFLNKEIINKNNERGLVVSFDDEHIVIKYENEEITYCPDVAFKNKYLSFLDCSLNLLINEDLSFKEELKFQHEKEAENNRRIVINRSKKINDLYKKISAKNTTLQSLFGRDFQYPPLIEFEKKYRCYITRRSNKYSGIIAETYGR